MNMTQMRIMTMAIVALIALGTTARGSAVAQGAMVDGGAAVQPPAFAEPASVGKGRSQPEALLRRSRLEAARAAQPPVIDGKLDDAAWAAAKPVTGFLVQNTTIPAKRQTVARVLYDDAALYIGMRCAEPDIDSIRKTKAPRDGRVFDSDCVEIMLDPARSDNDYHHIAVNVLGDIFDRACTQGGFIGDEKWDAEIQTATFIGKDFWSVEIAIPFYSLGVSPKVGSTWNINLCREKKSPEENSSIGDRGMFHIAGGFAELRGLNTDFSRYCYSLGAPALTMNVRQGALDVKLETPLKNESGKSGKALLACRLISPSQKIYTASAEVDSSPGEARVPAGEFRLTEQGDYTALVLVNDAMTKRPLAMRRDALAIKYIPLSIRLIEPWYRNAIFFTQNLKAVILDVEIRMKPDEFSQTSLEVALSSGESATNLQSKTVQDPKKLNRIIFDATTLPEGKMNIIAVLKQKDGKALAETAHPLLKLPHKVGEVWLGKDMNWRVDGKPFCFNGAWLNYEEDFLKEFNVSTIEKPGYGCLLSWATLDAVPQAMWPRLREKNLAPEIAALIREAVRKKRDNPDLFAYYSIDEPEGGGGFSVSALEQIYRIIREEDPYHPVVISNDSLTGLQSFARCAEINGLHLYPAILKDRRINDLSSVAQGAESAVAFFRESEHKQTIAHLHQGFSYGDMGAVNQRIPNYREYRSQDILAVICGAKGWLQFNRTVQHYPELYIGMPHLARELKYLEPVVLAPEADVQPTASNKTIKMLLKDVEGELYLLACNASMEPCEAKLAIPGIGKKAKSLSVISEDRQVAVNGGAFTDKFDTFEAHIYTTATKKPELLTVKEICKLIDAANAKRKKPGNLAFQMFEGDGITVSASSKKGDYGRPDNGLWHMVDGIIDNTDDKTLTWQDKTDNAFPDWLEIQLPQAQTISRVVVYPFRKSLKDYAVQGWLNGEWKDLDRVTGKNDEIITHTFAPLKTDRIRIFVTAANGPNAMISEVEIYAK